MKKGLSDVVTTVLIILFAIVAVAIIGGIVLNQVNKAGTKIEKTTLCSDIQVEPTRCSNDISTGAYVVVQRGSATSSARITNVTALFEKTDGTIDSSYISDIASLQNPLGSTKLFSHTILDNVKRVGLAVELTNTDGSKTSCDYYKSVKQDCFKGDKNPALLGYWPFDTSGDYKDYSGKGNDLVLSTTNAPTFSSSPTGVGGYLSGFDGTTDKSLTNAGFTWPTTYSQATVSFWAKVQDSGDRIIFGVGNPNTNNKRFEIYLVYTGNSLLWDYGDAGVSGRYLTDYNTACSGTCYNSWKHIVAVSNGVDLKNVYINGVAVGGTTTPADYPGSLLLAGLYIGKGRINSLDKLFKGDLDEFMIYNQTLSAAEVKRIYDFQRSKFS